jgi:tetratricopeptide (TPR) repeat protein
LFDELNRRIEKYRLPAGALLVAITLLVFAGALSNGFVYDDGPQILQNPFVQNPHLWKRIFTGSVWSFQGAGTNFYRPLQFACYWILYRLSGPNPAVFHLLNLLLYAASAWLVYRLGRELLANELAALAGALLWALHPVHVETVAWISALPDAGFGFFALLAFWLFLRAERSAEDCFREQLLSVLAFFVALFFKEMALGFPFLLLAYWFFLGKPDSWRRRSLRWSPYLAAGIVYGVARHAALGYLSETRHFWEISPRVIGAAVALLGQDTRILFWPFHLNVFRVFYLGPSLCSPWPWITLLVIFSALWLRKREPLLAFLIVWWPLALLPVLDIRQLSFPRLADRFLYFPSVGVCLVVAYLLLAWLPRRFPRVRWAPVIGAALSVILLLCAAQTIRAIPRWRDNDTLMNYSLTQSPNAALLHMERGVVLEYEHGDLDAALQEYETARRLNRQSSWPLGLDHDYFLARGRIALRRGQRREAIADFERVLRVAPDSSQARDALGAIYFPEGDYAKAAEYFAESVKLNPQDLGARFYLGTCWMKLGKYQEAAREFHAAREIDPEYWQAYVAEAQALDAAGEPAAAARVRSEAKKH